MSYMERCTNDKCENKEYSDFIQKTPGTIDIFFSFKCIYFFVIVEINESVVFFTLNALKNIKNIYSL